MAQHDYNIGDQNGFDFLVDLNNALSAIATNNAGPSEPNPTFANMFWFDTNNDLMKMRNEANSAWVNLDYSPTFTGVPTAPTAAAATNTTQIATTAYTRTAIPNVLNATGSAPMFACRAWVNFDGIDGVRIRASGNVSSITDNGTGDYMVNFTTDMEDGHYAATANWTNGSSNRAGQEGQAVPLTYRVGFVRILLGDDNADARDGSIVSVAIFR